MGGLCALEETEGRYSSTQIMETHQRHPDDVLIQRGRIELPCKYVVNGPKKAKVMMKR